MTATQKWVAVPHTRSQIRCDPAGRYCLNDLHQASGGAKRHQPGNWTMLAKTKELIAEVENEKTATGNPVAPSALVAIEGGAVQGTYAIKELVYAYAMWISPRFHLHVIRAYDAMVQAARGDRPVGAAGTGPPHRARAHAKPPLSTKHNHWKWFALVISKIRYMLQAVPSKREAATCDPTKQSAEAIALHSKLPPEARDSSACRRSSHVPD